MFTYLIETVFPSCAEFFGNLSAVAQLKPIALLRAIEYQLSNPEGSPIALVLDKFNTWEMIDGNLPLVSYALTIDMGFLQTWWGRAIFVPLYPILTFFFAPVLNAPMWLALPLMFSIWGLVISIISFFIKIIEKVVNFVVPS